MKSKPQAATLSALFACSIKLLAATSLTTMVATGAWGQTTTATKKEESKLQSTRLCDTSGCYVAWNVVDSDGDGVCDADEIMAHTDPFDARVYPRLDMMAQLGSKAQLPSFEVGRGAFMVFPTDIQSIIKNAQIDILSGAPFAHERKNLLQLMGVDLNQLEGNLIDISRDGFAIGLGPTDSNGKPTKKMGGVDVSLISAEAEDCCFPLLPPGGKTTFDDGNGNRITEYPGGQTLFEHANGSGEYFDKNKKLITTFYINPDADPISSVPSPERIEAVLRLRGLVTRTIEGWNAQDFSGQTPPDKKGTIALIIDSDYPGVVGTVVDAPRVTTAQPDTRPDLPNPGAAGGIGGARGGCLVGC
jgi:Bacterial TSP3 repeat